MIDAKAFWTDILNIKPLIDEMVRIGLGEAERSTILASFSETFDRHAPGIDFEFGVDRDGIFEFIISAGGIRAKSLQVQEIVAAAPKFEKWRIIAFKPRQDLSLQLHVGGQVCEIASTRVSWKEQGERIDVRVFLDVPQSTPKDILTHVGFLVLDIALGELDVMTRLGTIDAKPLASDPTAAPGLPTIAEFVAAFDKRFGRRVH